ncbi:MAG: response regulator [Lachnospiraceae bacterium]|nr:response regulator [Lachnospiraceae bacterium]
MSDNRKPLLLAVDDESTNRILVKNFLSNDFDVICVETGVAALNFVAHRIPDIILMDYRMPEMTGKEVFLKIKEMKEVASVPVIFLTAEDDRETEKELFQLGAMDFISKPFVPEIARERVLRIQKLKQLQNGLEAEVEEKTKDLKTSGEKLERLSKQMVLALAGTVDAKDTYTRGHSFRVAKYSKEIAKRLGKTEEEQNDIYMSGLLHDLGKIGIPDTIINKPTKLTDEEYELIQNHPVVGSKILEEITEMPGLYIGARWHHERYDGKGYPDGLQGDDIPMTARIIGVADSYDTMSSNRSYRKVLPQAVVRKEILDGKGSQFDPVVADVMLQMIDEDVNYDMRQKDED